MKKTITIIVGLTMAGLAGISYAEEMVHPHGPKENSAERRGGHQHAQHPDSHGGMKKMANKPGMFMVNKEVDGFDVIFHVMPATGSMRHGGSTHNVMVKVEKDGVMVDDVVINSKVFLPNKETDSKMLMKMGDWYMAGYNLDESGENGIMVLFKTADGKKHKASVYYPDKK